jgi:hypothetical protein
VRPAAERAEGSARRTSKLPISRAHGTMIVSIASQEKRSPGVGSSAGWQLMMRSSFLSKMLPRVQLPALAATPARD